MPGPTSFQQYLSGHCQLPYTSAIERHNYRVERRDNICFHIHIQVFLEEAHLYANERAREKDFRKLVRKYYKELEVELSEIDECLRIKGG
jgi:hypothetical protein